MDLATYQELGLEDPQQAVETYQRVLSEDPTNIAAAEALLHLRLRQGQWDQVYELFRELSDVEEDAQNRSTLLLAAALLADQRADHGERARISARALGATGTSELALAMAVALFRKSGDWEEAIRLLEEQAESQPEVAAAFNFQISRMQAEQLGQMKEALAYARRASELNSKDPVLLDWLADLYRREASWSEMVDVLRQKAQHASTDKERVEIRTTIAEILEHRLGRSEDAIAELDEAVKIAPTDMPTLQSLGRLLAEQERWEDLLRMHLDEARASDHEGSQAVAYYRAGRILVERLGRPEEAIENLERAAELDPQNGPVRRLLESLYRQHGRSQELVVLYNKDLDQVEQGSHRIWLLENIASLQDSGLGQTEEAIGTYRAILDLQPTHLGAMHALVRLHEAQGDYPSMLSVMRALVTHLEVPRQKAEVLVRMAQIIEERLKDPSLAIAHYEEALAHDPEVLELYEQIGRLLRSEGRWLDLVELYRREVWVVSEPWARVRLLFSVGRIYEQHLDDPKEAVEAYLRALEVDSTYWPALSGILRLSSQVDEIRKVAELEAGILEQPRSAESSAAALVRLGLLLEEEEIDLEAAQRFYRRAAADDEGNALARFLLLRAMVEQDRWAEAIKELPPMAAGLVAGACLRQLEQARDLMKRQLEQDPESLSASRWLEALYAALGDRVGQVEALVTRAKLETEQSRRAAARFRLAALAEHLHSTELGAVEVYRDLLDDVSDKSRVIAAMARVARQEEDDELLAEVHELEASSGSTPAARAAARTALASRFIAAGQQEEAIRQWRQALEEDPRCRPAYDALKLHYFRVEDDENLLWVLERGIDAVSDPAAVALDLVRRADIRLKLGDSDAALRDLDRVLDVRPAQPNALERVVEILKERGDLEGLIARLTAAAEHAPPPRQAVLYHQLGLLARDRLEDPGQAERFLTASIDADPDNVEALLALAYLRLSLEQPAEALSLLNRVALRADGDEALIEANLGMARICLDYLGDPSRARNSLDAVLEADPKQIEGHRAMVAAAEQLDDSERLERSLRALIEVEEDSENRASYLARVADLVLQSRGVENDEGLTLLSEALELAPGNTQWLQRLVTAYEAKERWSELDQLLEIQLVSLDEEQRAPFLLVHGRVLGKHLDRSEDAVATLRQLLKLEPANEQAAALFLEQIDQLETIEDPELLEETIRLYRIVTQRNPIVVDSLRSLRTLLERAERRDEAYCIESSLIFLGEASEEEIYFHKKRKKRASSQASGTIERERLEQVALPEGDHPVREALKALRSAFEALVPPELEHYGLEALEASRLAPDHPARDVAGYCAGLLGVDLGRFELVEARGGVPRGCCEPGDPGWLLLPPGFLQLSVPDQRWLCGRLLTRIALGTESLDPGRAEPLLFRDLELLLVALQRTADPEFGEGHAPPAILDDLAHRMGEALGEYQLERARSAAAEAWSGDHRGNLAGWVRSTELGAFRGGLICCGNIGSATRFLREGSLAEDVLHDLVAFTISESFAALRRDLGLAIKG
jgi:tetratricopeptide (TPR) repeat protein